MSFDSVRRVSGGDLASLDFRPRAAVRGSVAGMTALSFSRDEDDFDAYESALGRLEPSGLDVAGISRGYGGGFSDAGAPVSPSVIFMLLRYVHEPVDQLTICLPLRLAPGLTVDGALGRITAALGLPAPHWRSPEARAA